MHRRTFLMVASAAASAIAVRARAARPQISSDTAPGVNFSAYKTYAWVNPLPPGGMDPVAFERIRSAIEADLFGRGYQKADPGDLSLILSVGAREKTQFESWGRFGLQTDVYQYTQGMLSLDAFDTKTKQAVWHGQASETINPNKPDQGAVAEAINKLIAKFPPGGGAGAPAPGAAPP